MDNIVPLRQRESFGGLRAIREGLGRTYSQFAADLSHQLGVAIAPTTLEALEANEGLGRPPPRDLLEAAIRIERALLLDASPEPSTSVAIAAVDSERDPDMAAMLAFRLADRQIGGGHLYASVVSYLATSMGPRLLTGSGATFTAAASLTEMAGWMAYEAGRGDESRSHFERAWDLAHGAHAPQIQADVAAGKAHLELQLGDPGAAINSARQGRECLAKAPTVPGLLARLHLMQARGEAALGCTRECVLSLTHAECAMAASDGEASPWVAPFDEASLAGEMALALYQVGDYPGALRESERVLELRSADRARSRAFAQLSLARTLLSQQRPDPIRASAVAHQVLEVVGAVASSRIRKELQQLQRLIQPYQSVGEVRGFLTQLYASPLIALWRPG